MGVCAVIDGLSGERAALAAYVLRTLLGTLGLPHEVVTEPPASLAGRGAVWYGRPAPATDASALVEIACLERPTLETPARWLVAEASGRRVAVLGAVQPVQGRPLYREASGGQAIVAVDGSRVRIGADLVAAAGFWLTGGDEEGEGRDAFGRFPAAASPRCGAGLLQTPVVTDLMNLLWEGLGGAAREAGLPLVRVAPWPAGREFAVLLSHDVDLWRKRTARQLAKELARSAAAPRRLGAVARAFARGPDPWSDLGGIADLEERRGMHSTFFFLPGRPDKQVGNVHVVNSYPVDGRVVSEAARRLVARGWEVGLHGSFDSFLSAERLASERSDLEALAGQPVKGCRQHFLRIQRPTTWRCQAEAGLEYDATLGYHDTDGYRAGFSFPFHPFDGRELPLLELPLMVMDGALFERQRLGSEAAWERVRGYLERTKADGAMLGLLWHNTYFCELDAPGYRAVYERALDWIGEHNGWGASAGEIAEWWTRRSDIVRRQG